MNWAHHRGKRAVDVAISISALALTAPLQALAAVAVRLSMGSPVLFRQERPGLGGRPFTLVKFRTMTMPDEATTVADDARRLTPVGRILRATSTDELPTLWNVLRGDMSIVGPRPLLPQYLTRYTPYQARRHEVKPGVTGLAQVNGRNSLSWDHKFELDVRYVDQASPWLDLTILWGSVWSVLRRDGVQADGSATMPEFMPQQEDAS